jgi:hypothetical protein
MVRALELVTIEIKPNIALDIEPQDPCTSKLEIQLRRGAWVLRFGKGRFEKCKV